MTIGKFISSLKEIAHEAGFTLNNTDLVDIDWRRDCAVVAVAAHDDDAVTELYIELED